MDATTDDSAIARSTDRHRPWRRIAACVVSVVLHAGVLAAALANLPGETQPTEPEALTVALVVESASGGGARDNSGGKDDSGEGNGAAMAAADAGRAAERSPPPAVVQPAPSGRPTRRPPEKTTPRRAPIPPPPPQPQAASKPQQPSPDPMPPSPAEAPAPVDTAEPVPTVANADPGSADGSHDPVVASLGNVGATAGSAATGGGRERGHSAGSGSGSGSGGGGGNHGPGFALGSAGNPMPPYPPSARRRGIEGTVVLRVEVSAEGRPLSVEIARSSGSDTLDAAARDTIARWRFRPATRGGEAITATASVPVRFSLVEP